MAKRYETIASGTDALRLPGLAKRTLTRSRGLADWSRSQGRLGLDAAGRALRQKSPPCLRQVHPTELEPARRAGRTGSFLCRRRGRPGENLSAGFAKAITGACRQSAHPGHRGFLAWWRPQRRLPRLPGSACYLSHSDRQAAGIRPRADGRSIPATSGCRRQIRRWFGETNNRCRP